MLHTYLIVAEQLLRKLMDTYIIQSRK